VNRALLKTCTYGMMHLTVAITVAYAMTRSWKIALAVGIVEPLVQTFAFALHERAWTRGKSGTPSLHACAHGTRLPTSANPAQDGVVKTDWHVA